MAKWKDVQSGNNCFVSTSLIACLSYRLHATNTYLLYYINILASLFESRVLDFRPFAQEAIDGLFCDLKKIGSERTELRP